MFHLSKPADRDFVILNLTDPQLSDGEWGEVNHNSLVMTKTVETLVSRIRPDLITVSGDIAWAKHMLSYRNFADFLDSLGIPWAPVWGNHDNQCGEEEVDRVANEYLTHPLCLYEKGDPSLGNGNYVIRIEEDGRPVTAIFMMDSHDRMPYETLSGEEALGWAKLIPEQLNWYREQIAALEKDGCRDSALILHIPPYGYKLAADAAFRAGVDKNAMTPDDCRGTRFWNDDYADAYGVQHEGIGCYPCNDGVIDLISILGSTKHIIAGHDHINNTVIPYRSIKLVYSLKTGPGCYWEPSLNGGTYLFAGKDGIREVRHEFVDPTPFL